MKRTTFILAIIFFQFAGVITPGCDSKVQDDNETYERIYFAKQDLESLQSDSDTLSISGVSVEKWENFRNMSDKRIIGNESLIDELKTRIKKSGKRNDMLFEKRIYILEQQNKNLRQRISAYPEIQSDWDSFKQEITSELDQISMELKGLDVGETR